MVAVRCNCFKKLKLRVVFLEAQTVCIKNEQIRIVFGCYVFLC